MRRELLYKPHILLERLATATRRHARLAKLRNTCAADLFLGHIDSLELLELVRNSGINNIFDVGANVGTWTSLAKAVIPKATIQAFEPYSPHVYDLRQRTNKLSGVRVHPVALGSENGSAILRVTKYSDASSILPAANQADNNLQEVMQVQVPTWRLDDYCLAHRLDLPDLLKLDVQGFELEVLRGGATCLENAKAIITEVSFIEYYRDQCLFHDLVTELARHKFILAAFGVQTPTGALLQQTDALFVRNRIT